MALLPGIDDPLGHRFHGAVVRIASWLGLNHLVPGDAVDSMPLVDLRLRPRVPMATPQLVPQEVEEIRREGIRNPREVTAQTHPELFAAWTELCTRAGYHAPMPRLLIGESNEPNATQYDTGSILITTGFLKLLTLREVVAVLGHEIGHSRHPHTRQIRTAQAVMGAAGIVLGNEVGRAGGMDVFFNHALAKWGSPGRALANFLSTTPPGEERPSSLLGYVGYILAGLGISQVIANQVIIKPTELQADLESAALTGDPEGLASALGKLEQRSFHNPVIKWFAYLTSGYPTLEERASVLQRAAAETPPHPIAGVMDPLPSARIQAVDRAERLAAMPEAARING